MLSNETFSSTWQYDIRSSLRGMVMVLTGILLILSPFFFQDSLEHHNNQLNRQLHAANDLHINASHWNWSRYVELWLPIMAVLIILISLNFMLLVYYQSRSARNESITSLPWRRPWTWIFVLLTSVPIGWIFWLVSGVRRNQGKRRRKQLGRPQTHSR